MKIQTILKKYGLSEHEAALYVCLLKHIEISAFQAAKETGIPRATAYRVLAQLQNMGVVSSWRKNNVAYFTAESPKRLIKMLDEKKEMVSSVLEEMLSLRDAGDLAPNARIYVGADGLKFVWDDILDTAEATGLREIHALSGSRMFDYLPKFFPEWVRRREKLGVFVYLIGTNPVDMESPLIQSNRLRETRLLPSDSPIKGTIDIYGDKIAFFSLRDGEVYSVILESSTIAEMLRQFFMATWQLLERK